MNDISSKPNLLFFQFKYDDSLPEFLLIHKREHVRCLSKFFNVTVVSEDCDYGQLCDKYRPDLALFEGGVNHRTCRRLNITNTRSHPDVPKLALHHGDGFCNARAGFLSDIEHWGIDTVFAISVTAAEHTPDLAEHLYVWPVFTDPNVFKDYKAPKNIPVLFTGNTNQFYPWRSKILKSVAEHYPSLICPHPGYGSHATTRGLVVGAAYARLINASWFVPACGTVAKEVVRKHFEIPGSRACLVTERSPGLEAAGFVDMKNCVFADEHDVLDKLDLLFNDPETLGEIISAGYEMVHSRHTMAHRNQIFQWFTLRSNLKRGQKIVQLNPFGSLSIADDKPGVGDAHMVSDGIHLQLLRQGDEKLWAGQYLEAETYYLRSLNYMRWLPELKLRLALSNLYAGKPKRALEWLSEPIHFILCSYKAADPDPVEWAYFLICQLCLGQVEFASRKSQEFPWLQHPELDRARWVVDVVRNQGKDRRLPKGDEKSRRSIHRLPARSMDDWLEQICLVLTACKQSSMAELLKKGAWSSNGSSLVTGGLPPRPENEEERSRSTARYFERVVSERSLRIRLRSSAASLLHKLELKYGYFLPYRLSESRNDEFFKEVRDLARDEKIENALIIGASSRQHSTQAFLAGILENQNGPTAHCIEIATAPTELQNVAHPRVHWYWLSPHSSRAQVEKTIERIRQQNAIHSFDLLLIDGSELDDLGLEVVASREFESAKTVILEDTTELSIHKNYRVLSGDLRYLEAANNPDLRNGYAIFKKCRGDDRRHPMTNVSGS